MRIAYLVHQYFPDHVGGTEIYTRALAQRALSSGNDVVVLTGDESPSAETRDFAPRHGTHENVRIVAFPFNLSVAPNVARYEYDNPFIANQVRDTLDQWRPDVVHVTHAMKLSGASVQAAQSLGIPTVVTLCDFWFLCPRHTLLTWDGRQCSGPTSLDECVQCEQHLHGIRGRREDRHAIDRRWPFLRGLLEATDRIVALSPFQARIFAANGLDSTRVDVIPHGIDTRALRPPETSSGSARFVCVGSLIPSKGLHIAIAAVRSLPQLDLRLKVHGPVRMDDPYTQALMAAAAGDDRITFAGAFAPAEIGDVLADADFLLLPSLSYDNEPLVVKQAKHIGVAVIVSDIGSLIGMVEDDVNGWRVPPGDEDAWRTVVTRAVGAHESGRRWVAQPQPDMDEHCSALEHIYQQLVAS